MGTRNAEPESRREQIAIGVIIASGSGIVILGTVALIAGFSIAEDGRRTFVMAIFNTLVPLFGTWVGTVIAFYFSRENFAAAAQATRELVSQLGDDRLRRVSVKDAWVPVDTIEAVPIPKGKTENDIAFKDVQAKLSTKVSRVPIWNSDMVILFILHESMIYKYAAEKQKADPMLSDFLAYDDMRSIVTKIVYVSQSATLADAKSKMVEMPGCQDIVVTATGARTEPILGWVTNAAIAVKERI